MAERGGESMTDINLLKSKMILAGYDRPTSDLSKILSISYPSASLRLNDKRDFTQREIAILALKLGLTGDEVKQIFLQEVVTV